MKLKSALFLAAVIAAALLALLSFQGKGEQPAEASDRSLAAQNASFPSLIKGEIDGGKLMTELGCNACHAGLADSLIIQSRAPRLGYAGRRYNPAYLFSFLQSPSRIRHHIGHSRMPDFQLSREESLALTLFLSEQNDHPAGRPDYPRLASGRTILRGRADLERGAALMDRYTCFTCHTTGDKGTLLMTDLSLTGQRLRAEWVQEYLAAPHLYTGNRLMPNLFYRQNAGNTSFDPMVETPEEDIKDITAYLFSLNTKERADLENDYESFRRENKNITADLGESIYKAQNCGACHHTPASGRGLTQQAPDLSMEGQRVKKEWLNTFLKQPTAIRPHGFHPGSGSRMPDFRLSDEEVALIGDYLHQPTSGKPAFEPQQLSVFSTNKAEALLSDKLPCLGCHQLNGQGGKIGPSLDEAPGRLNPAYVYQVIKDPHALLPGTAMPRIPMPDKQLDLIVSYLVQPKEKGEKPAYASLSEHPPYFYGDLSRGQGLYLKYCAACHGQEGGGDGFNAANLPAPPTVHADATYISSRPDDTLYDGIYAGGYILNKSNRMPAYGYTLIDEEIRLLVGYIRKVCNCEGPGWSLDN